MSDDKDELRRLWAARREQEKQATRDAMTEHLRQQHEQQDVRDALMDQAFEKEIHDLFGTDLGEIEDAFSKDDDADVRRVMGEYNKQMARGNKDRAKKVLKKNKAVVKKSVAKNKSGCLSALVLLVGTAVTLVTVAAWGAVEAFAAIVR